MCLSSSNKSLIGYPNGAYPSEVTGGLKIDEVVFGGVQRAVPVAVVGVVVAHCEGRGLWETAGCQLSCVIMRAPLGLRPTVRIWCGETVNGAQLPPPHLTGTILFHHHHLVGTGGQQCGHMNERNTMQQATSHCLPKIITSECSHVLSCSIQKKKYNCDDKCYNASDFFPRVPLKVSCLHVPQPCFPTEIAVWSSLK